MQEATTFNIFYDGISFQHLATVLISVFTLCYGPGLLFVAHSVLFLYLCHDTPTRLFPLRMLHQMKLYMQTDQSYFVRALSLVMEYLTL
jgi:hypothetical protein